MKHLNTLATALVLSASALSANAAIYDAKFTGTVQAQVNAGVSLNSAISGEFIYDTDTAAFTLFTVGGQSSAAGATANLGITPDQFTSLYQAQISPLVQGGNTNSTFKVDLEGLSAWSTNDALALLSLSSELASNLDKANSSFGFYRANADGTGISSVDAVLTGLQVSMVPEPGSLALLCLGLAGMGVASLRRRQG